MEVKSEDPAKVSRTEIRKQKLAEYLAAKGRLKPPNPKPYLKDSTVLTNPKGAVPKSRTVIHGKENSAPSATGAKKEIAKKNLVTVLPRLPLRTPISQSASQKGIYCKTACAARNDSVREQQTKAALYTNVTGQKQNKTVKKGPLSVSNQAQALPTFTFNPCKSIVKTDLQKRRLVTGSEKVAPKPQVNCPAVKERLSNTVSSCRDTKSLLSKKATVTLKPAGGTSNFNRTNTDVKKTLSRFPVADRSAKAQTISQDKQIPNKPGNNPGLSHTQRSLAVRAKQGSRLLSTFKPGNGSKSTSETVTGVTKAVPHQQQRRTTFNVLSKPSVQAPVPQTLPRPTKPSSLTTGSKSQPKTPKSTLNPGTNGVRTVPLDGRNKSTAAQEERLRKLKEWRESKGITYKRPPMPVQPARRKTTALPPQGYWSTIEQEDEVHGFVCAVDQSLNDCIKLLQQGCPVDQVRDVLSRVPMAQKFAKYWICQVRLMEQEGNLDVLPAFEEAVRLVREPVDELRSVVFEILKKKEAKGSSPERENDVGSDEDGEHSYSLCTPKPVGALIRGEKRESSVIKYKITATPGGKRSQQKPGYVNGHEIRFITPVRRSLRIEKTSSRYPAVLQERDPCVSSVHELLAEDEGQNEVASTAETPSSPLYVYRENEALREHVQIQLVYDDTDAS